MQIDATTAPDLVSTDTAACRSEHAALVSGGISSSLADVLVMALDEHDDAGRPAIDLFSVLDAAEADRAEFERIGMRPEIAEAEAIIKASPTEMAEVVEAVARGDVEGARSAADTFGRHLGSRVRAAFGLSGDADG